MALAYAECQKRFLERRPAIIATMSHMLENCPAEGYIASCEAVRDMDQRETLTQIIAPTLVVAGALDAASPPADGRFLANAIRGARYLELEAAHLTNIEAASAFNEAVVRFLLGGPIGD